ncbi:acyloxyacyl hydrolase [Thalassotalea sp. Y01]|uniref:acyloxyacyl hydrolase n=1 Tax=Thalassotalea sp. Y01 TaxID=2729613 RepID=UPI00145C4D05|nr:acyloxyacyl hydrolase [Thalassotalea sp. Y01]NMP14975.1 acyloxyacyl hydrolase [Thalassotalea sp. Y01]
MKGVIHTTRRVSCILLGLSGLFLTSAHAIDEHQVAVSYGYPTTDQNLDIQKVEVSYLFPELPALKREPLYWYPVVNAGQIQTSEGDSEILGGGLGLSWYMSNEFKVAVEGGMYWYSDYEFGEQGVAYKDYGGPIQFYYRLGPVYSFDKDTRAGFAFQHISNANRYDSNPAFDSYQLYFAYDF